MNTAVDIMSKTAPYHTPFYLKKDLSNTYKYDKDIEKSVIHSN